MSLPGYANAAAVLFRGDDPPLPINVTGAITPQSKADTMRRAFQAWAPFKPTDLILQGFGDYDFGNAAPVVWPACTIDGMGPGITRNHSSWFEDTGANRVAFQLSDGTTLEDMSLMQTSLDPAVLDPTVDAICCGPNKPNISAALRRIHINGRDWSLYCWQELCKLLVEDFFISGGRVCVANEDSGNGSNFTLNHGLIVGDASLSQCAPEYDVSNPRNGGVFGLVARGGTTILNDVEFRMKGLPPLPRACAITDVGGDNDAPGENTTFKLWNVRSSVDPNGLADTNWFDMDIQNDYVAKNSLAAQQPQMWGSMSGGAYKSSSAVI